MRLAIVTPGLALRAGLSALLAGRPGEQAQAVVTLEAATLDEAAGRLGAADVLVVTAAAASLPELQRCLAGEDGRLALLVLDDLPEGEAARLLPELARLPLAGWGLLALDSGAEELLAAVTAAASGLAVTGPGLLAPWLAGAAAAAGPDDLHDPLTARERQVLQLLAHGLPNKQIAGALKISEHTVKFHISAIYQKLGVANRTEAVRSGVQRGLVYL